ncbi:MAG: radical SAM family heme chaperone HemW [Gammaproteobacteria bacterium]
MKSAFDAVAAVAPPSSAIVAPPPLSLYAHLPWCARKCPYCDFNSHRAPAEIPEKEYIRALLADAESALPAVWGRRVSSVFIGGGTPSLFSPEAVDSLLRGLRTLSLLPPECEITLEANPGSSDAAKFAEFAAAGINRLSLGAQSFDDRALSAIGRIHDGAEARRAARAAAEAFDDFNIDLMHSLPGQSAEDARADVQTALSFCPPHLSLYQLTLESGTPFFRRPPRLMPPPDDAADIGDAAQDAACDAGFRRYEISAFARAGRECRHNLNYWRFGDYVGIGAGAHGKITAAGKIVRQSRIKNPREYMRCVFADGAGSAVAESREVAGADAAFEFMLNALRLPDGFAPAMLAERAGVRIGAVEHILDSCEQDGLLFRDAHIIRPTENGLRHLNEMLARFLPE